MGSTDPTQKRVSSTLDTQKKNDPWIDMSTCSSRLRERQLQSRVSRDSGTYVSGTVLTGGRRHVPQSAHLPRRHRRGHHRHGPDQPNCPLGRRRTVGKSGGDRAEGCRNHHPAWFKKFHGNTHIHVSCAAVRCWYMHVRQIDAGRKVSSWLMIFLQGGITDSCRTCRIAAHRRSFTCPLRSVRMGLAGGKAKRRRYWEGKFVHAPGKHRRELRGKKAEGLQSCEWLLRCCLFLLLYSSETRGTTSGYKQLYDDDAAMNRLSLQR